VTRSSPSGSSAAIRRLLFILFAALSVACLVTALAQAGGSPLLSALLIGVGAFTATSALLLQVACYLDRSP
jgi:hypothetical protein